MTDTLKSINTNDLRDYADRISNPYSQLILDAASELDATRTERNILRAALTQPAAVEDGWQQIETAPRDGTRIILAWGSATVVGYYLDNSKTSYPWKGWQVPSMEPTPPGLVTHWRPLPPPPEAKL